MESIIQLRQMMAEKRFAEVEALIEPQLAIASDSHYELLLIYYECQKSQQKKRSSRLLLELADHKTTTNEFNSTLALLEELSPEDNDKDWILVQKIKITALEKNGFMDKLHSEISSFLIRQFEKKAPFIPSWITEVSKKYFKNDYGLKLKELALLLLKDDCHLAEKVIQDLIISSHETKISRNTKEKLFRIGEILNITGDKHYLKIYQNYCFLAAAGKLENADYKRIVEMIIFFDDFKIQVLILDLLDQLDLKEEAHDYAFSLKKNRDYDFVYLVKYFFRLKKYFIKPAKSVGLETFSPTFDNIRHRPPRLEIEDIIPRLMDVEDDQDEKSYISVIKHKTYSGPQLCDIAVSFLQAELPKVALIAAERAVDEANNDEECLKASYLIIRCQLMLKDFRAALDTSFKALGKATSSDDILSFLYGQAEIYIRLKQTEHAKIILKKILLIDSRYRLAKERLDRLNEI